MTVVCMADPLSDLANVLLKITAGPSGASQLPGWMVNLLAGLSGKPASAAHTAWASELLVRQAVALYQAASARRPGRPLPGEWLFSPDHSQAVHVLPALQAQNQQRELALLGRLVQSVTLNHPRLTPVLQVGVNQGYPFLAARIDQSFEALTKRMGLPVNPAKALRIAEQVLDGLEYAHFRGVFHGALRVEDILIDERGHLTVLGVGMAQLQQRLGASLVGAESPLVAPETAQGALVDARADVFAVAALLYVLLTGKAPRAGQTVAIARAAPELPPELDAILTKALATNPDDRYQTLLDFGRDLRRAVQSARPAPATGASLRPRKAAQTEPAAPAGPAISGFPDPLPMPEVDLSSLEEAVRLVDHISWPVIEMPEPPSIPLVNWEELLQPVDVSSLSTWSMELPWKGDATLDPLAAAQQAALSAAPPRAKTAPGRRSQRKTRQ